MTNKQILTKAFNKAIKNGYEPKFPAIAWFQDKNGIYEYQGELSYRDYYIIIFSHDFAKAIWGENNRKAEITDELGTTNIMLLKAFEYHLMKMVLEEDPLKYLEKFI